MTIQDIEAACTRSEPLDFRRHPLEAPELTLQERFHPMGFPVDVRTNSLQVLDLYRIAWRFGRARFDTEPIVIDVHVVESTTDECPSAPGFRMMLPLMVAIADNDNYCIHDVARGTTQITISSPTLRHPLYANYFFLEFAPMCHMVAQHVTPVHAGCVEWNGKGILLCGDSGAGKSTLSYACARAGFGYISDDATFLLSNGEERAALGNPHKVRLRPESVRFFPEMKGIAETPRAAGKPSVEIRTGTGIVGLEETRIDYIVFLNRRNQQQQLVPYSRDVARQFMRQVVYGLPDQLDRQYRAIEQVLQVPVYELHYTDLEWAQERLKALVQEGA